MKSKYIFVLNHESCKIQACKTLRALNAGEIPLKEINTIITGLVCISMYGNMMEDLCTTKVDGHSLSEYGTFRYVPFDCYDLIVHHARLTVNITRIK